MTEHEPKHPPVYYATQEWTEARMAEQETRIERAIANQTAMIQTQLQSLQAEFHARMTSQNRWIIGLGVALVLAIIVRPILMGEAR